MNDKLRLRKYDGNYQIALPWYQDPIVYQNSEGILDDTKIPDLHYLEDMYEWLDEHGEQYFIEVLEKEKFIPIGDVTVKPENPPIVIGVKEYRCVGIGKLVLKFVIERLKELGYQKITNLTVYKWNTVSQKLHESLGFVKVQETDTELIYELDLQ